MRILDAILAGESCIDAAKFKAGASDMENFAIDNVAEYLYAQTDQEEWSVQHDFPCLAPPFSNFWMEYRRPSKIVSCLNGVSSNESLPYGAGFWFTATDLTDPADIDRKIRLSHPNPQKEAQEEIEHITQTLKRDLTPEIDRELRAAKARGVDITNLADPGLAGLSRGARWVVGCLIQYAGLQHVLKNPEEFSGQMISLSREKGARWIMQCVTFLQWRRHAAIIGPVSERTLLLTEQGAVVAVNGSNAETAAFYRDSMPTRFWELGGADALNSTWFPALLAISFLHCKNVAVEREKPPDPKLAKRQRERGEAPRILFKTLEITPLKATLEKAVAGMPGGLKRALHICRGHFADYQEGRGLFGKYPGRFWIPQHLRGAPQEGIVHKTYNVNAPK